MWRARAMPERWRSSRGGGPYSHPHSETGAEVGNWAISPGFRDQSLPLVPRLSYPRLAVRSQPTTEGRTEWRGSCSSWRRSREIRFEGGRVVGSVLGFGSPPGPSARTARDGKWVGSWKPSSTRARYALLVEPLGPELALVDPELAEGRAHSLPTTAGERGDQRLYGSRSRRRCRVDRRGPRAPIGRSRSSPSRSWGKSSAIVAAIALAALLGGAAAAWVRYDDNSSSPERRSSPPHRSSAEDRRGLPRANPVKRRR